MIDTEENVSCETFSFFSFIEDNDRILELYCLIIKEIMLYDGESVCKI